MRRFSIVCAILLLIASGGRASLAQAGTPEASPTAADVATPRAAREDLRGVAPLPLTGEPRAEFERYVVATLNQLEVPGASVAVVQGGDIVYAQGFGVRERGGTDPVTPDTLMMIGSVTKSMTSLMAATLIDDGWLSWQTPVVQLLPDFAVADPELTTRLTVADAFCACTGLPQRDAELVFNFDSLTPQQLIRSVAGIPLTAPLGEKYQYSNQMYVIGGYAAAVAAGATPADLYGGYVAAMRERVLNPIGMTRSTFALEDVLDSGDYAEPHATNLAGETVRFPLLVDERFVTLAGPAGALWSSARDMARYLQTDLARGVAPDGERVVSAENLERTWRQRVAIPTPPEAPPVLADAAQGYGLGWALGEYKGLRLISHNGGTFGFASTVAFLPEADLGVVVLTNSLQNGGLFTAAVEYRLFELLFEQPAELEPLLSQFLDAQAALTAQFQTQLGIVDPGAVAPYLGRYAQPDLGEVTLSLRDGKLLFDTGEVHSELRPLLDDAGQVAGYVFVDPPLANPVPLTFQQDEEGQPEIVVSAPGDASTTYVFTRLEPSREATPTAAQ
jgi:CubicO group peptidase (beta-lactamase class C family)